MCLQAMVDHFLANKQLAGEGLELLPGILPLLETLAARSDVAVCLVTGNLEPIGWSKMDALGIRHLFTSPNFGGFSSDYCNPGAQPLDCVGAAMQAQACAGERVMAP